MSEITVLAIPGSLRAGSINASLCREAARLAPADLKVEHYVGLGEIPHYDADLDAEEAPQAVADLRERISAADALLIATPEYNGGIPGALKNALDWASTPYGASVLTGMPVAVMGATPGRSGTAGAQAHLRQVLARIGCEVVAQPEVMVSKAYDVLDDRGRLTDDAVGESIAGVLDQLRLAVSAGAELVASAA